LEVVVVARVVSWVIAWVIAWVVSWVVARVVSRVVASGVTSLNGILAENCLAELKSISELLRQVC
jgi:hypothetical protein